MGNNRPFVSIVTPVYNGEKYLSQCIDSVLSQTYDNWEYIIVDNRSTDATRKIARDYATKTSKIKVYTNETFLSIIANWNHALRKISPSSKYCKVVHADDLLMPECITQMVNVAERHPQTGIIGAYRIDENRVNLDALPYPTEIVPGHEICRRLLLGGPDMFGSPTSILIRADLVRAGKKFYNENSLHADTEVCFDILQHTDFGFVQQVLTYTRRHNESLSSFVNVVKTHKASQFMRVLKYGRVYLKDEEFKNRLSKVEKRYYRFLGERLILNLIRKELKARKKEFWDYHSRTLSQVDHSISLLKVLAAAFVVLYNRGIEKLHVD